MDELSATLTRLLACALPGALAPGLTLVPAADVVEGLLADLAGANERAAVAAALGDVAAGRLDLVAGLGRAGAALEAVSADPAARAALADRLAATGRAIAQAQGLSAAVEGGAVASAELRLADPALLGLIQTLALPPEGDGPAVVVVGAVTRAAGRVRAPLGQRKLLDRVAIDYVADSPFPLLTLTTASRGAEVDWAADRSAWRQEPDLDLVVQNSTGSRDLGTISTAVAAPPWQHRGARLALSLPELAGHTLVATTVADLAGRPLAHCVRVYHAA